MAIAEGKIVFIDPNELLEEKGVNINTGDNVYWEPEKLQLGVDLQVIIPNRDSCGLEDMNASFNIKGQMGSFFQGNEDNFLTTEYTNISYQEVKNNNVGGRETLGIQSIDISFDSHFFPIVKMKMIDVRGYALMMPEQLGHEQANGEESTSGKTCESFFNALFHFPYPQFALSIKGYYGNRVTFRLSVESFQSSFNSNTGNFEIEINFIGNMYGIYSDIPFNFLILAPYFGKGGEAHNSYWENNPNFVCSDGVTKLPTFIELAENYESYDAKMEEGLSNEEVATPTIDEITKDNKNTKLLNELLASYYEIINKIGSNSSIFKREDENYSLFFVKGLTIDLPSVKEFKELFAEFKKSDLYDNSIVEPKFENFPSNNDEFADVPVSIDINGNVILPNLPPLAGGYINKNNTIVQTLEKAGSSILKDSALLNTSDIINKLAFLFKKDKDFIEKMQDKIKANSEKKSKTIEDAADDIRNLAKYSLGIVPTIENIFRMIYAHIDTFMELYFNVLKNIKNNEQRKNYKNYKELDIDKTDIGKGGANSAFFPPFTGFFDIDKNENYVRKYPAEVGLNYIEEVNFIESIYDGINGLRDIVNDLQNSRLPADLDWKPLMLPDINLEQNPYKMDIRDGDKEEFVGELLYTFLKRIKKYELSENAATISNEVLENEVENLIKAQENNLTDSYIKNCISVLANTDKIGDFKKYIYDVSGYFGLNEVKNFDSPIKLDNTEKRIKEFWDIDNFSQVSSTDDYQRFTELSGINLEYQFKLKNMGIYTNSGKTKISEYTIGAMQQIKDDNYQNYCIPCLQEFETVWRLTNLYQDENFYKMEDSGDTAYVKALMFLSTIIGHKDFYKFDTKKSSILRMPKFVALFLGGIIWNYREELEYRVHFSNEYPYILNNNGIYDRCGDGARSPLKEVKGLTRYQLSKEDENCEKGLESYFKKWAKEEFPKLDAIIRKCYFTDGKPNDLMFDKYNFAINFFTTEAQKALVSFYTEIVDFMHINKKDKNTITYSVLKNFCIKLNDKLGGNNSENEESTLLSDAESESTEILAKQELYYSLKNIYDKWIGSINRDKFKLKTPSEDNYIISKKMKGELSSADNVSEFDSFIFIDNFYKDVKNDLLINPKLIYDMVKSHMNGENNRSILQIICDIAQDSHMNFIPLPVFNNFYDIDSIKEIFTPHALYDANSSIAPRGEGNTYVLMYNHTPSKNSSNKEEDDLSVGYKKDYFLISNDNVSLTPEAKKIFSNSKGGIEYTVPAFNVSFGKQNQMYFKGLTLNMNNPRETNESIKNLFILAGEGAKGAVKASATQGQDLFSVYTTRAYDCSVEMMGCANIIPTMYFQIQNIPIFNGSYLIYSVKHHIENGSMTTSFVGTKMSNLRLPYVSNGLIMENISDILNINIGEEIGEITYGITPFTGKIFDSNEDFVNTMRENYTTVFNARGIELGYVDYIVGQDALESSWGKSRLCKYNNLGGIKARDGEPYVIMMTTENIRGVKRIMPQKFRVYESLEDYTNRKVTLLSRERYQAFSYGPEHFYERVKAGGYATDPNYVSKLNSMYLSVKKYPRK